MEAQTQNIQQAYASQPSAKQDYYDNAGKKVGDFAIGFFGMWILNVVIYAVVFFVMMSLMMGAAGFTFLGIIGFIVILDIVLIFLAFYKGRRYIGIGAIVSVIVPLLIAGACVAVLFGGMALGGGGW